MQVKPTLQTAVSVDLGIGEMEAHGATTGTSCLHRHKLWSCHESSLDASVSRRDMQPLLQTNLCFAFCYWSSQPQLIPAELQQEQCHTRFVSLPN